MSGMFWRRNVWAGLRPGDAGDAKEELLVQQNTSAVCVALALQARRHTAQRGSMFFLLSFVGRVWLELLFGWLICCQLFRLCCIGHGVSPLFLLLRQGVCFEAGVGSFGLREFRLRLNMGWDLPITGGFECGMAGRLTTKNKRDLVSSLLDGSRSLLYLPCCCGGGGGACCLADLLLVLSLQSKSATKALRRACDIARLSSCLPLT